VYSNPYTIGYSVLTDAMTSSLPIARLINKAQSTVTASAASVAFALMGEGGNLDSNFNALLMDSYSTNAWPITGFSYYIIRSSTHIGSCSRRKAAMKYLYHYYHDNAVNEMAANLGFATIPAFIRDTITSKLVSTVRCNDGQYALSQFSINPTNITVSSVFEPMIRRYLSIYNGVDTSTKWNLVSLNYSPLVWTDFIRAPNTVSGVFTMFNGRAQKLKYLSNPDISSFAFGHIALVFIYHLDTFSSCTATPLRITNDVLIGIFTGKISSWNDSMIQDANREHKVCLPNQEISVIIQSNPSEAASMLLRYFTLTSPTFSQSLGDDKEALHHFDFSTVIPSHRLKFVPGNKFADSAVISKDSSFGFYLQVSSPNSPIASYCPDRYCSKYVIEPNDFGKSIAACQQDLKTIVNPEKNMYTYDLMTSTAAGCYPVAGTLDYSFYATDNFTSCAPSGSHAYSLMHDRIKLSSFLFNGSAIVKPLNVFSAAASTSEQRAYAMKSICDQICDGVAIGYEHCSYRDCSWLGGDYVQSVSDCSSATQRRTVTYSRSNSTCYASSTAPPPATVSIECPYVLKGSGVAIAAIMVCIIGVAACACILFLSFKFSHEKVLRRSQLIFIYIFLCGAILMNLTVLCMYGPNSPSNCMLRVWAVNLASTVMFAPLIMKLHRVDVLFHTLQRGGRRRTISDFTVGLQVLGLLSVDVAILLAWTLVDKPRPIYVTQLFPGTYERITDVMCNSSIDQPFERAMVAWKASLLVFGIIKSIRTWSVPKEISEAKYFALAIYNTAVFGSITYFLSVFGIIGTDATVVLKCAGIFTSATLSAVIIMVPKLFSIQLSWAEVFSVPSSSRDCSDTYSNKPETPVNVTNPTANKTGIPLNLQGVINQKAIVSMLPLENFVDRNQCETPL
jgi:ABC-type phosphate transport system substrate-binding protein